ncbi:hypothetical protein BPAE_0337g00110 [Botrytis paeoniae]|uniref:Uncharacterized protein n=1 Tax=Botrytis paeoniae TaxID=278948 RepID=A0A4Z1F7P0_9HELO|nr:hypothetical protein BPAE_0337g00110 [Botrytis paeoniae]
MIDSRLCEEFEKIDAPQLRNLLKLVCDNKGFALKHRHGKLFVKPENLFFGVDGFHDGKPRVTDFGDCDNYKEREKDVGIEVEDVPIKSKYEIHELVKANKKKHPGKSPTMFECENCYNCFCINNNPPNDCLWHPGQRITDLDDIIWAEYDPKKNGAIESLIDHPDFEDRWIWSCCSQFGSDWGCKNTRNKVLEEVKEPKKIFETTSEDSSNNYKDLEGSDLSDASEGMENVEEPAAKRARHNCYSVYRK